MRCGLHGNVQYICRIHHGEHGTFDKGNQGEKDSCCAGKVWHVVICCFFIGMPATLAAMCLF